MCKQQNNTNIRELCKSTTKHHTGKTTVACMTDKEVTYTRYTINQSINHEYLELPQYLKHC